MEKNNKGEKQSESLPNYFLGILRKKKSVLLFCQHHALFFCCHFDEEQIIDYKGLKAISGLKPGMFEASISGNEWNIKVVIDFSTQNGDVYNKFMKNNIKSNSDDLCWIPVKDIM